jgi:hypothetical protein
VSGAAEGNGGNGADGLVIISYAMTDYGRCTGGTITNDGTNRIHTFTTSGTFVAVAPFAASPLALTFTGQNIGILAGRKLAASVLALIYNGTSNLIFRRTSAVNRTAHSATPANRTQHTATVTNRSEHTSTVTNQTQH